MEHQLPGSGGSIDPLLQADQIDLSGQIDRLIQNGAVRVFEDVISGKTFNRPGLAALLDHARPNDTLAVIRLDHLGRSLKNLLDTVDDHKARDVSLISLEEWIDTTSVSGELGSVLIILLTLPLFLVHF